MQKMVNPTRYYRNDGVTGQIRTIPGAVNFWRGNPNEGIMLEPTTDKMPIALDWVEGIRNRVRTIFYSDVLQITDDREMTAYETRMRKMERMRLQGPSVGRLNDEMLGPMVERVFGILDRKGLIPAAPAEMEGRELKVEFISPLANVQKQEQLAGVQQMGDYLVPFGEMGLMELAKRVNFDRFIEGLADILQVDPDWFNNEQEMQAIKQQEATQRNVAMAEPIAGAANDAAGAAKQMSEAGLDVKGLLGMLASRGQQQQAGATR
jgi:hypothetical protein